MTFPPFRAAAALAALLVFAPAAFAQNDQGNTPNQGNPPNSHDTAKGAAVGAVAGHEVGSGHALAGAAAGAAVGHHEGKKKQRKSS